MQDDPNRLVRIEGKQFDHGGADSSLRDKSILAAIDWIESVADAGRRNLAER